MNGNGRVINAEDVSIKNNNYGNNGIDYMTENGTNDSNDHQHQITKRVMMSLEIENDEEDEEFSLMREVSIENMDTKNNNNKDVVYGGQSVHKRFAASIFQSLNKSNNNNNNNNTTTITNSITTQIRGFVRSNIGIASTYRHFFILCTLAMGSLFLTSIFDIGVQQIPVEHIEKRPLLPPHLASFGGHSNPGHYEVLGSSGSGTSSQSQQTDLKENSNGDYCTDDTNQHVLNDDDFFVSCRTGVGEDDMFMDFMDNTNMNDDSVKNDNDIMDDNVKNDDFDHEDSNTIKTSTSTNKKRKYDLPLTGYVGETVISITQINRDNYNGHYWHDPLKSPYSSPLYGSSNAVLLQNQIKEMNMSPFNMTELRENIHTDSDRLFFEALLRETIQAKYMEQLNQVRMKYGQWEPPQWKTGSESLSSSSSSSEDSTTRTTTMCSPNFDKYHSTNRDMPGIDFPLDSWQNQKEYVMEFLEQARLLVQRVKHGIYDEYGLSPTNKPSTSSSSTSEQEDHKELDAQLEQRRKESFGIKMIDYKHIGIDITIDTADSGMLYDVKSREPIRTGSYINRAGYDGLIRKLLHSMITQDDFYVIVVGGAHTYLGVNMYQTQIMQFHNIMEPIFNKLGINLISRNMGMDISSTVLNSLGGSDIYGEADIVWYIPDNPQRKSTAGTTTTTKLESDGQFDLLHIQSILSGQRLPLILTPNPSTLMMQQQGEDNDDIISDMVWMGNIQPGYDTVCDHSNTNTIEACEYVGCNTGINHEDHDTTTNRRFCSDETTTLVEQYNSVCWIERSDWNPSSISTQQDTTVGYENEQYPNLNQHKVDSRKFIMLLLEALEDAIHMWSSQSQNNDDQTTSTTNNNNSDRFLRRTNDESLSEGDKIVTTVEEEQEELQETQPLDYTSNNNTTESSGGGDGNNEQPSDNEIPVQVPSTGTYQNEIIRPNERTNPISSSSNSNSGGSTGTSPTFLSSSSTSFLLPDDVWHVTSIYKSIRQKVRTVTTGTACDEYLKQIDSEICHLEMHAFTEWTPRVTPGAKRLKAIIQGEIADKSTKLLELYKGVDVLPPQWRLNAGSVDVHLIAIAVNKELMESHLLYNPNATPPNMTFSYDIFFEDDDDSWGYGFINDQGDDTVDPPRRQLRQPGFHEESRSVPSRKNTMTRHLETDIMNQQINHDDISSNNKNSNNNNNNRMMQYLGDVSKTSWTVYNAPIGYCDGSSQSSCNRALGNKCLLSNYNHYKAGLLGHGDSGPLILTIPHVKEGIILLRFDWDHTLNEAIQSMSNLPDDFQFLYSLDNTEITVLSKEQFQNVGVPLGSTTTNNNDNVNDVIIHPLLIDKEWSQKERKEKSVQLQMEIRSESMGSKIALLLTHIYFA